VAPSLLLLAIAAGTVLQTLSGSFSVVYACIALLVQLKAVLRANAFLDSYASRIPEFMPLLRMAMDGWAGAALKMLIKAPWEPLL
jgi:hypothetical protein